MARDRHRGLALRRPARRNHQPGLSRNASSRSSGPSSNVRAASIAARLSPAARITYDIFVSERELALEGQQIPEELHAAQPDERPAHGSGGVRIGHRSAAVRHREGLRPLPRRACASSRAGPTAPSRMMRAGMARGITLPRPAMAKVVPQLREIVTATPDRQHLLGADRGDAQGDFREGPPAHQRRPTRPRSPGKCCRRTRGSRISSSATIYRPRAPRWAGADLPDGQAWYRWRIRGATTMDMPAGGDPPVSASRKSRASAARCSR